MFKLDFLENESFNEKILFFIFGWFFHVESLFAMEHPVYLLFWQHKFSDVRLIHWSVINDSLKLQSNKVIVEKIRVTWIEEFAWFDNCNIPSDIFFDQNVSIESFCLETLI